MPVHLGADAEDIAILLMGTLLVNHVAFWNYRIGLVDSPRYVALQREGPVNDVVVPLDDPPGTAPYVVLECWSRSPQAAFGERRWSSWTDPLLCFETPRPTTSGDVRELRLCFAPGVKLSENVMVVYLVAEQWSVSALKRGDTVFTGSPEHEVRHFSAHDPANPVSAGCAPPPRCRSCRPLRPGT